MHFCPTWRLRTITIDFELGVSNVFTKHYPSVIVRGCLFHFGQSLFRKSFAALSLLPLNHMLQGLQCLTSTRPEYPNIQGFLDYYHNTYGPFSKFPPHMYNLYRNITPRTINYLEGRHSRMKKHEQALASIARIRDDMGAPTPKHRKNKVVTDECLMKLWKRYDNGRIDITSFLKAAGLRYFQHPSRS
ncbi:unnamed protein product [Rotaria magnacalcarata]|uniref:MULE transposase domain-containing protein n=1 Tax=Rotaria magnacalcarata TaxID=392030 RepID=A0A819IC91_9BILA|nr:unnamed protein product [Rotaria magnacalcarata]